MPLTQNRKSLCGTPVVNNFLQQGSVEKLFTERRLWVALEIFLIFLSIRLVYLSNCVHRGSAVINPMEVQTEEEKSYFEKGEENKVRYTS